MIVTWLAVLVALVAVGARLVLPSFIVASNRQAILHKTGSLAQPLHATRASPNS